MHHLRLGLLAATTVMAMGTAAAQGLSAEDAMADGAPMRVRVAVMDFAGDDVVIAKSIAGIIRTDLSRSSLVSLPNFAEMAKAGAGVPGSEGDAARSATRMARSLGARRAVIGSYQRAGGRITILARVVDVDAAAVVPGALWDVPRLTGSETETIALSHRLADLVHYALVGQWLPGDTRRADDILAEAEHAGDEMRVEAMLDREPGRDYLRGDTFGLWFHVSAPCFVYVLDVTNNREVLPLSAEIRAEPGHWHHVPGREAAMIISDGLGGEEVLIIAATRPLRLEVPFRLNEAISTSASSWIRTKLLPALPKEPDAWTGVILPFHVGPGRSERLDGAGRQPMPGTPRGNMPPHVAPMP